jgi:hypothetical protein
MCQGGWQRRWCGAVQGSLLACSSLPLQPALAACPCSSCTSCLLSSPYSQLHTMQLPAQHAPHPAPRHAAPPTFLIASAMCGTSLHRLDTCCSQTSRWASLVLGSGCSAGRRQCRAGQSGARRAVRQAVVCICVCEVGALARPGRQARMQLEHIDRWRQALHPRPHPELPRQRAPADRQLPHAVHCVMPTCVVEGEGAQQHDQQQYARGPHIHRPPVVADLAVLAVDQLGAHVHRRAAGAQGAHTQPCQ